MSNANQIEDIELTNDHYRFLREAGASPEFLMFLKLDTGSVRHSVRKEIQSYVYYGELTDPEDFIPTGGGFFQKMWDGELFWAFIHADCTNRRHLSRVFGKKSLVNSGIEAGEPVEYVETMVYEGLASLR